MPFCFCGIFKTAVFVFFIFSVCPIYLLYGIYLPEWDLSFVSEVFI